MKSTIPGAALLLAACNSDVPQQTPIAPAVSEAARRMATMSEDQRNAVLIRAIRDAGQNCQYVAGSVAADAAATPTWIATCDDGRHWSVAIGANGVAQVSALVPPAAGS